LIRVLWLRDPVLLTVVAIIASAILLRRSSSGWRVLRGVAEALVVVLVSVAGWVIVDVCLLGIHGRGVRVVCGHCTAATTVTAAAGWGVSH